MTGGPYTLGEQRATTHPPEGWGVLWPAVFDRAGELFVMVNDANVAADVLDAMNGHAKMTADRAALLAACKAVLARIGQLQEQWGKEGFTDRTADILRYAVRQAEQQ